MIFNIVVNVVVRSVLGVVCGPQGAWNGMGWATGEQKLMFYTYDSQIARRDHIWVQDALAVIVEMLRKVGLGKNL